MKYFEKLIVYTILIPSVFSLSQFAQLSVIVQEPQSQIEDQFQPDTHNETEEQPTETEEPPTGILNTFDNLVHFAIKEEHIFKLAKERYQRLKLETEVLKDYIQDYESTSQQALIHSKNPLPTEQDRAQLIASSGIASYRMTYRYVHTLQTLREILAYDYHDKNLHDELLDIHHENSSPSDLNESDFKRSPGGISKDWPSRIDLQNAMQSLIHIQDVYGFDQNDLAEYLSPDTTRPAKLTAFHWAQIGLLAMHREYYEISIEFIETAIDKVVKEYDQSIPLAVLEGHLELVVKEHNDKFEAPDKPMGELNLFHRLIVPFEQNDDRWRITYLEYMDLENNRHHNFSQVHYRGLCARTNTQTPQEQASLKCWYDQTSNPAWVINPLKKELLSEFPKVLLVHEFLGNKMIAKILQLSQDNYSTSGILGNFTETERVRSRTSVNSWVPEGLFPELNREIEFLTGLNATEPSAAENLQVVDYTYGRQYASHPDGLKTVEMPEGISEEWDEYEEYKGDRIQTVLFYLNDVPAGGTTPFCSAGISAVPVKGSAVIWDSTYRNGTLRDDTWHGSCPVIYGRKLVANKWIRYNSQFLRYPCTLDRNE